MSTTKKVNTKTTKTNTVKVNETVFNRYDALYNDLLKCECKMQLVNTMLSYGLYTTTTPTTTLNKNDLYIQFGDKSRLLITAKSLKVYTNVDNMHDVLNALQIAYTDDKRIDAVGNVHISVNSSVSNGFNDGSYRTQRATIKNTLENFTTIMSHFLTDTRNYLPTTK